MLRLLTTVVLGSAVAVGVAWYFDLWPSSSSGAQGRTQLEEKKAQRALGAWLYARADDVQQPLGASRGPGPEALVLPECTVNSKHKQDVASLREGKILFIGRPVLKQDPAHPVPTDKAIIRVGKEETVIYYQELERGQIVRPGELVAKIDPTLALAEIEGLKAKKTAAEAQFRAADATYKEADAKVHRYDATRGGVAMFSREDYESARLMRDRYREEVGDKTSAIHLTEAEIIKAEAILGQHDIRNDMVTPGVIKAIYRHRGDTVKAQDQLMQLVSIEDLRIEGLAEVQYLDRLKEGARVSLEPVIPAGPWRTLPGHRGEINSVAFVGRGPGLRLVSGSEDRTVAVWDPQARGGPVRLLYHPEPVRVVACLTDAKNRAWCLTGCADGSLRLWDLDDKVSKGKDSRPIWTVKDDEKAVPRAITALAISPDGKYFASGAEDGMIVLWRLSKGSRVYRFDPEHGADQRHEGAVTSLHFTPQCRLISAGRDNTIRVWELKERGALMDKRVISGRGGSVTALGVTPDGGRMLFDKGRQLQILSVADGRTLNEVQGTFGATPFETLALFSPDLSPEGSLLLTAGAPEGRMQLWWTPKAPGGRTYEVRQLVTEERAPVTCAAFSDDAAFAASGSKDGTVYVWRMPTRQEVQQHRIEGLHLTLVSRALDANARQVRIGIDVHNTPDAQHPFGRLMLGRPVTVVIEP
jgi:WD40 repeat protein